MNVGMPPLWAPSHATRNCETSVLLLAVTGGLASLTLGVHEFLHFMHLLFLWELGGGGGAIRASYAHLPLLPLAAPPVLYGSQGVWVLPSRAACCSCPRALTVMRRLGIMSLCPGGCIALAHFPSGGLSVRPPNLPTGGWSTGHTLTPPPPPHHRRAHTHTCQHVPIGSRYTTCQRDPAAPKQNGTGCETAASDVGATCDLTFQTPAQDTSAA